MVSSWFHRWFGPQVAVRKPMRRVRLQLEQLEDRCVPATYHVLGLGDLTGAVIPVSAGVFNAPTLRSAINAANDTPIADIIDFNVGGTILVNSDDTTYPDTYGPTGFVITSNITIAGSPTRAAVSLDGNAQRRIFGVMNTGVLSLQYLTLLGGNATGGNGGDGSGIGGGGGAGLGGAIFNEGVLNIRNCTLTNNTAQGGNGGDSTFFPGTAGSGGGMGGNGTTSGPGGGPNGGAFPGGNGGFGGGGAAGADDPPSGDGGNGGFGGGGGGVSFGLFAGGDGGFGGGGSFTGTGGFGGGNGNSGGGGGGAGMGGAIFNNAGTVSITNSTISGNTAQGGAGQDGADAGQALGGGIFNLNGVLNILNSTIVHNTATQGGGIYYRDDGFLGSVNMSNTILADSDFPAWNDFDGSGDLVFGPGNTNNLVRTNAGFVGAGTIVGVDPTLGGLANNGGPTQTHMPDAGSPVINAGNNAAALALTVDQRGYGPRRVGPFVDIGAVEVGAVAPTPPTRNITSLVRLIFPYNYVYLGFGRFQGIFTIVNVSGATINGPIRLSFPRLLPGVTVFSATTLASLRPGQAGQIRVIFNNPLRVYLALFQALLYRPVVLAG